jgi:GNAT superfamily N-acetyltransferase
MTNDFYVTSQLAEIDVPWVIDHLRTTYWASWRSPECITESLRNSICFGLFERVVIPKIENGKSHRDTQVGFARVVTDYSTVSYLCDVYIEPRYQHKGLGKFLVQTICTDHRLVNTVQLLRTKTMESFYLKCGFKPVSAMRRLPEGV